MIALMPKQAVNSIAAAVTAKIAGAVGGPDIRKPASPAATPMAIPVNLPLA